VSFLLREMGLLFTVVLGDMNMEELPPAAGLPFFLSLFLLLLLSNDIFEWFYISKNKARYTFARDFPMIAADGRENYAGKSEIAGFDRNLIRIFAAAHKTTGFFSEIYSILICHQSFYV
jgi:hypothetical protein